jgi:AAA+ ATPase superfamily predicted ATPase
MDERMPDRPLPPGTVGRGSEWASLTRFASNDVDHATLGIVWGRRRIGKSYLLAQLAGDDGLYYEAVRGSASEALAELGAAIATAVGAPAPLRLPDWDAAIAALLRLGEERPCTVVLDEYPYLREQSPELDSIIQRAFGPRSRLRSGTRCRLILCGSAMSTMSGLLAGTAPLRGRAGLDLRLAPFDHRDALQLYGTDDLALATRLHAVIGGVAAYARDMVDDDLPGDLKGFDAWIGRRVLSPSAPLSREVDLLLSEDPTTSQARKVNLYHAALAAVALGRRTPSRMADYVNISGQRLDPILRGLVDAGFIERLVDPVREHRPTYQPGDPIIRFHYAILRPNHTRLSRHGSDLRAAWKGLQGAFTSAVVGPTFESMARQWVTHHADLAEVTAGPVHVGPSLATVDHVDREVDLVVARDDGDRPIDRSIAAIGEAKSGERITSTHLGRLEAIRSSFGSRAVDARLILVGARFDPNLVRRASKRSDVELVDLERLYRGS